MDNSVQKALKQMKDPKVLSEYEQRQKELENEIIEWDRNRGKSYSKEEDRSEAPKE